MRLRECLDIGRLGVGVGFSLQINLVSVIHPRRDNRDTRISFIYPILIHENPFFYSFLVF